ncbi:hypothetical protein BtTXDOH_12 [Burkholderia phage phiBt-TXDOH]|nr:hypothetical protein BtTXDOH_12 [Burkholderia phage phiBt-TXDOH]
MYTRLDIVTGFAIQLQRRLRRFVCAFDKSFDVAIGNHCCLSVNPWTNSIHRPTRHYHESPPHFVNVRYASQGGHPPRRRGGTLMAASGRSLRAKVPTPVRLPSGEDRSTNDI